MSIHRPSPPPDSAGSPERHPSDGLAVVGIGASAGGLEACRRLLDSLPPGHGMALVLVQHLDPTHESLMADLLAGHTTMTVAQASDGERLEPDHLHLIPPGADLAIDDGVLRLTPPQARHGSRLPYDFFLRSLARSCGPRAIAVVLSGSGADGSGGLGAVKEAGGFVIVQDPDEAGFDGMPRSAIATGAVDRVLPVDEIGRALIEHERRGERAADDDEVSETLPEDRLVEIIELLRARTAHDFRLYKPGTLRRRIERRVAAVGAADADTYLERLRGDARELEILAGDLLINVTGFFRDAEVFAHLAEEIVPILVRDRSPDRPLRIWVPGCSTGEEAYSLAMLFLEAIAASKRNLKLQVFASDVDADAVATAREGLYPSTIEADVSIERRARFFVKEEHGWRVSPDLRGVVVFTVQDVLSDPPFSRLDFVSCRNLLIYLGSEAQEKVLALFHFALREGGLLLLGRSESAGDGDGRFEPLSKLGRLYRRLGSGRSTDFGSAVTGDGIALAFRRRPGRAPTRQSALAELCRRLVMDSYAPAAVLIDRRYECLYSVGPTDRYLRVAAGHPSHDLFAQVPDVLRVKLRSAIQLAVQDDVRVVVGGGRILRDGVETTFTIDVRPVHDLGEDLILVCFVDDPTPSPRQDHPTTSGDDPRIAELERELDATRRELQGAIRSLEISNEEQKVINEEALSANEEFQSTNEELLTSKEELQSLNEELTALNGQLQETLERHRTTSNDLQNVLYSTDVATLFLDTDLDIRFFTPATRSLFNIIPSDVGRPLADLRFLADDEALLTDAKAVMRSWTPIEREIEAPNGVWFIRRVLPYRTLDDGIAGVVITFADVTERRRIAQALEVAKRQAERASLAKSRFLAAANHDLRQPLQTLCLLQGLLADTVEGERAVRLVGRLGDALGAMTGMLDTLLDMNQIEAGTVQVEIGEVDIADVFARMSGEFTYAAEAKGLTLRVFSSTQIVRSDQRLLEQMIRNLVANALKYTPRGKVLIGCRRHGNALRIEVWDTGIGIAAGELQAIFEEYHQIDNAGRDRTRGLGLGLSIVQRLGDLLGHRVRVHSRPAQGSVFSIDVPLSSRAAARVPVASAGSVAPEPEPAPVGGRRIGSILVVEDEPDVRELLELVLEREGHLVVAAPDGVAALKLVVEGTLRPDLVLADFNLPGGINGLEVAARLRQTSRRAVPAIILTGDISTDTLRDIDEQDCFHIDKPVRAEALTAAVDRLLAPPVSRSATRSRPAEASPAHAATPAARVFVVDDDAHIREALSALLTAEGLVVEAWESGEAFLAAYRPGGEACLLIDAYLPGMSGLDLLHRLAKEGHALPSIMITGRSDVAMAVEAMKAGASDFLEKPVGREDLLAGVTRALAHARDDEMQAASHVEAARHLARLTPRQIQIMELVLAGHPSKNIAADLGISQRTVENHRAAIMKKTGTKSLPALARLAAAAAD